uniref:uncharacterized protein LOC122597010 n=1 Tax=Erigeron canadensis TaxID=72917 RepID=UPI001CB915DA|nr:uncharacterized protein LOC122597010 [Erigeron canadensis]
MPIFLNIWLPTSRLKKEDIKEVSVWIKIHDVPIATYSDVGLSMLATKLGNPKMLDTYTNSMCSDAWGRSSYARMLVEVSAVHEFKNELTIAIPSMDGDDYTKETMRVEYEWRPPRCSHCCVFGHNSDMCPSHVVVSKAGKVDDQGFTEVKGKKKVARRQGFSVQKQNTKFVYKPVSKPTDNMEKTESAK